MHKDREIGSKMILSKNSYNIYICIQKLLLTYILFIWFMFFIIVSLHSILLFLSIFFAEAIYTDIFFIEKYWCHQCPERSFILFGRQLPLCARCCTLFLGATISVIFFLKIDRHYKYLKILFGIIGIGFIDIFLKIFGLDFPSFWRAISGFCIGAGIGGILTYSVNFIISSKKKCVIIIRR